jgi:hypothetical protein
MINYLLLAIIFFLLGIIGWFLWKSGFLFDAETPTSIIDKPVMDAKERKAFMKRLKRWRAEGKVTLAEFETILRLCDEEWDAPS